MNVDEWISDYIFSHQNTGVRLREIVKKSKMWDFDPKYIEKYIKDMFKAGRLVKFKGKLFPAQDEFGRELKKVMYAKRQKIARELLKVAKELLKEGQ